MDQNFWNEQTIKSNGFQQLVYFFCKTQSLTEQQQALFLSPKDYNNKIYILK